MTKYKEYLRAKRTKLEYDPTAPYNIDDFDINTCAGIEIDVRTEIMDNCIAVVTYSNITTPEYEVYNRRGECCWFDNFGAVADLLRLPYDKAYVDWIVNMGCDEFDVAFDIMKDMYHNDAKVRIAFNHVKAGIMDELVFYRWISDRYQKYTNQ